MFSLRTLAVAASVLGLFACSQTAGTDSTDEAIGGDEAALVGKACTPEAVNQALVHYKAAVAKAKRHGIDACGDDDSYLMSIAQDAAAATASCSAFSAIIEWSPWAAPIRKELAGNLVLAQLTGDLTIKDATGAYTYAGLETALAKGVTLWGPAPGAYGNKSKIELGANGKAKVHNQLMDDNGNVSWSTTEGTYTVGNAAGDTVMISITAGGIGVDYDLKAVDHDGIPDFELTPIGDAPSDNFTAYVSECEA